MQLQKPTYRCKFLMSPAKETQNGGISKMGAYFSLISQPSNSRWVEEYGMMSPKRPGWPAALQDSAGPVSASRTVSVLAGRQGRSGRGTLLLLQPSSPRLGHTATDSCPRVS